jgi:hypothetical protein
MQQICNFLQKPQTMIIHESDFSFLLQPILDNDSPQNVMKGEVKNLF